MKTTGAVLLSNIECFMQTDIIRDPAGDTHTLDPRPRPATCVVAVKVNPLGKWESSFGFLNLVSIHTWRKWARRILLQHRIRTRHNFSIHEILAKFFSFPRPLLL